MMGFGKDRLELCSAPGIAAGRQSADCVAVVALAPRDDVPALRLAISTKYWRAIFSAASTASEPPETR